MARSHRTAPSPGLSTFLVLIVMAAAATPLRAATSCYDFSCAASCSPAAPVAISTLIAAGQFPTGATTPIAFVDPNDGLSHRLIATQQGAILVWNGATGQILPTPFLDLRSSGGGPVLYDGGERGLLAMAVQPDYAATGLLYVFYTRVDSGGGTVGDLVVARYQRSAADPDVADPASAAIILVIDHSSAGNHNGGWLAFGPDGFLYLSTGDGGGGCDGNLGASGDGQRADTLLGKILRLDVRGIDPMAGPPDDCGVGPYNYMVPSTNPFFGQEPACDEVWVMGLRNPFRYSFDRVTGDLYVGDVGQNKWEEIGLKRAATPAPVNFGWPCREGCETAGNDGSHCSTTGCPVDAGTTCQFPRASGFWDPILCHRNPGTNPVTGWRAAMGGYRYRGSHVLSLYGAYFYSDAYCGQIWKTTTLDPADPAATASTCWASGFGGDYGFAEDHLGELYVVVGGAGRVDCIHNGAGCYWAGWGIFSDGFESGDVSHWTAKVP